MKTTARGLLTELRVQVRLAELGAGILLPAGHDHPFDMVAYRAGRYSRVQAKTLFPGRWGGRANGTLRLSLSSVVDRAGGRATKVLTPADCDVVVGFDPDGERFYAMVPDRRAMVFLRLTPTLNNNTKRINLAVDYELTSLDQIFR